MFFVDGYFLVRHFCCTVTSSGTHFPKMLWAHNLTFENSFFTILFTMMKSGPTLHLLGQSSCCDTRILWSNLGFFSEEQQRLLYQAWWRHQMETFSTLLAICAGNSPAPGEFPAQRPVTRSFDVFFDLHPNKRLSKQWWGWWFETPSCPLWRHRNGFG